MAEELENPKTEAKIIAFSGPKEGAGKTTLVLNLALGWAGIQKRPVLIVPLDPLARQEHSFYLDIKKPVSVVDILKTLGNTNIAVVGGLLRGKISMSQWGVGVLPLGNTRAQMASVSQTKMGAAGGGFGRREHSRTMPDLYTQPEILTAQVEISKTHPLRSGLRFG